MNYRTKSVLVEAHRFFPTVPVQPGAMWLDWPIQIGAIGPADVYCTTPCGTVRFGDWMVRWPNGEWECVSNEQFSTEFEPAKECEHEWHRELVGPDPSGESVAVDTCRKCQRKEVGRDTA